jgi:6-phosphogluconolactonase (cycloisomerase 2 family)
VGDSTLRGVSVEVFTIASNGTLAAIAGSPFTSPHGDDSTTIRLSPGGTFLYVGNANSATLSEFHVAASGKLTKVPGSPFADGNSIGMPTQIAPS